MTVMYNILLFHLLLLDKKKNPWGSLQHGGRLLGYPQSRLFAGSRGASPPCLAPQENPFSQLGQIWSNFQPLGPLSRDEEATRLRDLHACPCVGVIHLFLQGSIWLKDQALTTSIWCFRGQHGNSFNILDFPDMPQKIHSLRVFKKKGRIHHWRWSHVCTAVTAGRHLNSTS